MLELWHEWISSQSLKVRVALAEKQLPWVEHRIDLMKLDQTTPAYLALNPNGVVPTLRHEGRVILESSVICEYLEDVFPERPLRQADPFLRTRERAWLKFQDEIVHPALRLASFQLLYKPVLAAMPKDELEQRLASHPRPERANNFRRAAADPAPDLQAVADALAAYRAINARLDADLADGRTWLASDTFSLADVAMSPFVDRLPRLAMDWVWDEVPRVRAWTERMLGRPGMQAGMTPEAFRLPLPGTAVRRAVLALG